MNREPANGEAPPGYTPTAQEPPNGQTDAYSDLDITAKFAYLNLPAEPPKGTPNEDTCLAHLKLLHAIHSLKEDVGYSDGLWGLWDDRVAKDTDIIIGGAVPSGIELSTLGGDDKVKLALSRLREKRWAIFVARAVDRYEAWWDAVGRTKEMLTETDMKTHGSRYIDFPTSGKPMSWSVDTIPPLGKWP